MTRAQSELSADLGLVELILGVMKFVPTILPFRNPVGLSTCDRLVFSVVHSLGQGGMNIVATRTYQHAMPFYELMTHLSRICSLRASIEGYLHG